MNGALYRVKAQHPRRPGPLVITDKAGKLLAVSGETCGHLSAVELASMLRNGYIEPIEPIQTIGYVDAQHDAPRPTLHLVTSEGVE